MKTRDKKALLIQAFFLAATIGIVAGCETGNGPGAGGGGAGGSVVGNGNIPDESPRIYRNDRMNLNFSYPRAWQATESEDRTRLVLASAVAPVENSEPDATPAPSPRDGFSRIEFEILSQLDGVRFNSEVELMAHLRTQHPTRPWQEARFIGRRNGLWYQRESAGRRDAEYFVIDENLNVLHINYSASASFDGIATIDAIIRGMTIDDEPPVVERIFFEPSTAKAGETVKVVVIAKDELSGVDPNSMGGAPESIFYHWAPHTILGYNISKVRYRITPAIAFPLTGSFQAMGRDRFEYEFKIPENATAGEIVPVSFEIKDRKGNPLSLTLDVSEAHNQLQPLRSYFTVRTYGGGVYGNLARETLTVERESGAGDSSPPVLNSIRFDRSLVSKSNPNQRIYVRMSDESSLRRLANVRFSSSCASSDGNLIPIVEDPGLYYLEVKVANCFDPHYSGSFTGEPARYPGTGQLRLVYLVELSVFDVLGNYLNQLFETPGAHAYREENDPEVRGRLRFELEKQ